MNKNLATLACLFLLFLRSIVHAEPITVYVANNPPLISLTEGKLDGISGKLLKTALEEANLEYVVVPRTWVKAQEEMQGKSNSIFAATGRNKFTEDNYDWFYKAYTDDVNIWTKSSNPIASDAEIIGKAPKVAIRNGSPFFAYAADKKIDAVGVNDWFVGARMVLDNKIQGLLCTTLVGNKNFFDIEKADRSAIARYKIGTIQWYIVRPKDAALTPELSKLLVQLDKVRNSAAYQELLKSMHVTW